MTVPRVAIHAHLDVSARAERGRGRAYVLTRHVHKRGLYRRMQASLVLFVFFTDTWRRARIEN